MYRNQFRPDRFSDHSTTVRRPGRSTHHWVVSGGRGSAAPAARPRSPPNRSGRSGNVQQYRPRSPAGAVPQRNATTYAPVASATDARKESANQASLGSLESQKTLDVADQSDDLNLQSAEGVSAADFPTPTMHSKGYSSTEFTLQFGSLNPGVINNQCTARATSAPPDMDEKKHDKAHHGLLSDKTNLVSLKPAQEQQNHAATNDLRIDSQSDLIDKYDIVPSTVPSIAAALNSVPQADKVCTDSCKELPRSPSSPTQQHWQRQDVRKDVINATQSDTIQKYPATKPKISVQIPAYTPNVAPPAFVLPLHGRPMPISFQQKQSQVPVEFRGPGVQVQSISSLSGSLPANMAVPMGSAPHMPQFFVHGPQPRALQQQAFIHQGQGLGCAPPASRHLPKLGNMRITTELSQQQPRSCDEQKRPIKITHPDTHKELRLDRRGHLSGQIHVQNMNHRAQPVSTFTPHHNMYYPLQPSIYNTGSIYAPHTNTIPLTTRPICPKVQPTRHSFDPANSYASIKPPMRNPWFNASHKPPNILQAAPDLSSFNGSLPSAFSALGQGTVKSPTVFFPEKNEVLSQTSSPTCMEETPTLLSYSGESALSNQQKMHKLDLEISPEPKKEAYEGNLKLAAGTPGIICNTSPQAVPTQKTHTGPSFVGHAASVVGPPSISVYNSTSVCIASSTSSVTAKPVDIEESPMPAATLLSDAKGKLSHIVPLQSETFPDTEASTKTDNVISTLSSIGSDNADGTSLDSKNLKYDGKSILGKPPLTYKQETLLPKFSASSACNEGLYAKVNPVSFPEKNYEVDCSVTSVPLQIQDMTCSKSKEEQVDLTTMNGLVSASENGTDVGQSVRCQACPESGNPHLSVSIDDFPPSNRNRRTSSGARIGTRESENKLNETIVESARILKNTAPVSSSRVSYQCSAASASMTQTKKSIMESTKAKTTHGRRKRRKDILSKADLYNESSSLDENFESFNTQELVQSSSIVEVNEDCTPNARKGTWTGANDNHNNLLDWEDATEFSTENLGVHGCKNSKNGARANKDTYEYDQKKKYSRDFLLTFAQSCVDLPKCFNAGFDGLDAVIKVNNELHPNHGRIKDRASATSQVNRHAASSKFDEDNWRKSYPSLVSGRGSSRSHSQNQSTNHYTGEILCKAMKEVASQRSTSRGSVDERWQHRTSVKGISSPSQVPIMHRAEKKYEIGKVSDEEEAKQRQLKAILNKLTPQNFEKLFEQVKDLNIDNIVTLAGVISQIFDKALMEPTFCEMYASFCFSLAGELPNFVKDEEKITFKRLLLNKCQEEFERGEREQAEANKAEEEGGMKQSEGGREEKRLRARRRMLGNIRLIGELYKKKMLTERIMHECIKKLLGEYQHPDEEDLEALCKLMSTIGEMIDHSRAKVHMDFYFHIIQKLSANSKLSSRIRFMLEDVIDLRNNKWRQRRKVEGPKKIEEVRRDAVKQKMSQSTRLGSSPNYNSPVTGISSASRPGPPPDNGIRGYSAFASRGSSQVRAYGSQNGNMDTRYQHSNRALLIPLQQRRADNSIRLGPQGDLGKEMSLCGKPAISDDTLLEVPLNIHHGQTSQKSTQNSSTEAASNRTKFQAGTNTAKKQSWGTADHALSILVTAVDPVSQMHTPSMVIKDMCCEVGTFPDEVLQVKAISTIKEFYSAKDEKEVGLCMKEMNAPSFYPSLVSLWINDSFERKDLERELLAKLLVNLCKSQESLLSHRELLQGFQHVLSTLEDAVTDAPKATEFLGRLFAQVILEDVISLKEIGGLLQEGREEPERPASEQRLASEVLGSMLESIRVEKGDSAVEEICAKSKLHWENLRRAGLCI